MRPALIVRDSLAGTIAVIGHGVNVLISGFQSLRRHLASLTRFVRLSLEDRLEQRVELCRFNQTSVCWKGWDRGDGADDTTGFGIIRDAA